MLSSKKIVMVLLYVTVRLSGAFAAAPPQCNRCPAGKFKSPEMIFSRCTACPENTFSSIPGAGRCSPCINGTISRENSAACFCPNGTLLVDSNCTHIFPQGVKLSGFLDIPTANSSNSAQLIAGIASLYNISEGLVLIVFSVSNKTDIYILGTDAKQHADNINKTTTVKPPMLQNVEQTVVHIILIEGRMQVCGRNQISTGTACVCAAGYTRTGGQCVACAAGKVKVQGGDAACDTCTNNTFSATAAVQCVSCPVLSVAKQDHTSCVCNTGFVFYNGTCTALESVYVRVFGDINVTQDTLTTSQLENLLLDGMSLALNLPKDFIIILIIQSMTTTTAAISTTPRPTPTPRPRTSTTSTTSAARTTTTPIPRNSSNSTHTGRRLLNVPTQLILFESYLQAVTLNQLEKVQLGLSAAANLSLLLKETTGLKVTFGRRESVQGFVNSDGSPFPCPSGRFPRPNTAAGLLECIAYETPPPPEPENNTALIATIVVVLFVMIGMGVWKYASRRRHTYTPVAKDQPTTETTSDTASAPATASNSTLAPTTQVSFLQTFYRSVNLQFPATVAIEYHLVSGQSM